MRALEGGRGLWRETEEKRERKKEEGKEGKKIRLNLVLKTVALGSYEKISAFIAEGLSTHPQIN